MGINELITNEDYFHIHKSLGIYVIFHYFYQYIHYFVYGGMNLHVWNMLPHMGLHLSSFMFHVLHKRIMSQKMAMFIWEELRLHSMIFAFRACLSILIPDMRGFFVFFTMISADIVTKMHGVEGTSTVRGTHDRVSSNWLKQLSGAFFSTSQMGATLICAGYFQYHYSPVLAFSTLPPIQTSAFGMTLIRKNIINKTVWQIVYGMELSMVYILWYQETGNMLILPLGLFCYLMRKCGMNKYLLFLLIGLGDQVWRQFLIINGYLH